VLSIPSGPVSSTGYADGIVDMLVADNTLYCSIAVPGGTAGNGRGYVVSIDLETGYVQQVGEHFGSTGLTGGCPGPLCWYQGKLWVGCGDGTSPSGRIAYITPGVDAAWTTDVNSAGESVCSLCVFLGDLYAGFEGDAGACSIKRRTASTGAWANVTTGGTTGSARFSSLVVYNNELYAVELHSTGTDINHIKKSADGTTWTTDADLDASFGGTYTATNDPMPCGQMVVYNGDLYAPFISRGTTGLEANYQDGFIMRKTGGVWSKVYTGNVQGGLAVLLERS
jgi:hypothetical protein